VADSRGSPARGRWAGGASPPLHPLESCIDAADCNDDSVQSREPETIIAECWSILRRYVSKVCVARQTRVSRAHARHCVSLARSIRDIWRGSGASG